MSEQHQALIVGLGLIGQAACSRFSALGPVQTVYSCEAEPWQNPESLCKALTLALADRQAQLLDLVWCAGRAGFAADEQQMNAETALLQRVLQELPAHCQQLRGNLISSAGGVYASGARVCRLDALAADSAYGQGKMAQEALISAQLDCGRIFRVSSAYGSPAPGVRHGLIATMIRNGVLGLPTSIHADSTTQRDFLLVDDVASQLLQAVQSQQPSGTWLLASARSIALGDLVLMLEKLMRRKVKVHYIGRQHNAANISYAPQLLPADFRPTGLEEGLRLVLARSRSH